MKGLHNIHRAHCRGEDVGSVLYYMRKSLYIIWLRSSCVAILLVVFASFFYNGRTRFCFLFFFFLIEYITTCSPYIFCILFILLNQQDYCIFLLFSNLLHSAFALAFFVSFSFLFWVKVWSVEMWECLTFCSSDGGI